MALRKIGILQHLLPLLQRYQFKEFVSMRLRLPNISVKKFQGSLRSVVGPSDGKGGGGACHLPASSAANTVASQGSLTAAPLLTTPEGASHPSGAFWNSEIPPRFGHAPGGGIGPGLRAPEAQRRGRLKRVARWLDDSWVGDLIGVVCLFGGGYLFLLLAWAFN